MPGLELRSAGGFSDEELAGLFNAAYEDYPVPFALDANALRLMTTTFDLDRDASRVALRDGQAVGVANLGVRGADAWIGGVGVIPAERRRGTGRAVMTAVHDEARGRGVERVWLEVIVENTSALSLYEQLGYEHVRTLEVWSLLGADGTALTTDATTAHDWVREHRTDREPWQRADESLAKVTDGKGLSVDGAAAVIRVAGGRVSVVQIAGETESLVRLLSLARALGDQVSVLNLPEDHPAAAALERLGGRVDIRQHEMMLTF